MQYFPAVLWYPFYRHFYKWPVFSDSRENGRAHQTGGFRIKRLENKVAIITGASGGLGKQTARRFAQEGARLAICARTERKLMDTKALCEAEGAEVLAMTADVSQYEQLKAFVEKAVERFGTVDVLVNNAATISAPHPFIEHTLADLEEGLHSGLYGTWFMMQLCYSYMKEKGGSIINFSSIGGVASMESSAAYAAEKEAIRGLSRVAAREWGAVYIRVNCICPNVITDRFEESIENSPKEARDYLIASMSQNAMHRPGRTYEDATPAILFLACDDSRWVTGQTLHVEGGNWTGA